MATTKTVGLMARDNYGQTYHNIGPHPRKWLLDHFGRKSARRVYIDRRDGTARHVGYVIAGRWFHIYKVSAWKD